MKNKTKYKYIHISNRRYKYVLKQPFVNSLKSITNDLLCIFIIFDMKLYSNHMNVQVWTCCEFYALINIYIYTIKRKLNSLPTSIHQIRQI